MTTHESVESPPCFLAGLNPDARRNAFPLDGYVAVRTTPDPCARITVGVRRLPLALTARAHKGFASVHQDLQLGESRSVRKDVCVGALVTDRVGRVKGREKPKCVHPLMPGLGVSVHHGAVVPGLRHAR